MSFEKTEAISMVGRRGRRTGAKINRAAINQEGVMLTGRMMDRPLLISSIIDFAADIHPNSQIVSAIGDGRTQRMRFADIRKRIIRLAHGLRESWRGSRGPGGDIGLERLPAF